MTFFDQEGKLSEEASKWIGPLVALIVALGGIASVYAKFSADIAVENERLKVLEAYEPTSSADHDLLIGMKAQLARIEQLVASQPRGK